jgi:hypothetical protein
MKYTMNKKELGRLALIRGALDGRYSVREAVHRLGSSERRIKQLKKVAGFFQGNVIYFSKTGISQNIEEFLTTKAHQGAEGRNKALLHASFVCLIRL